MVKAARLDDTPVLRREIIRRRSVRLVGRGGICPWGKPAKRPANGPLKFDNPV